MEKISIAWRGKKFILQMNPDTTLQQLGDELQKLTDVKPDTMRLIVPQSSSRASSLIYPFSEEHSGQILQELCFPEGKSIRMMGVPKGEMDELLDNAKKNLRIAGFDEEEKRMKWRTLGTPHCSPKLPRGTYVFCGFRTLYLPGVELKPPASEALALMHRLAADSGIVAIMNKHRWRVGIMTEMAPVGYVGVSPKCILGFNKNNGEEISLRLRTDDLKGFRKYESIKKTLLHELAHMVYSEHDANFYALDKLLNKEAAFLDWTRSKSQTLSGFKKMEHYEEEVYTDNHVPAHKVGGKSAHLPVTARESTVAAAYHRLAGISSNRLTVSIVNEEPDPDDSVLSTHQVPPFVNAKKKEKDGNSSGISPWKLKNEPDLDNSDASQIKFKLDPDENIGSQCMESEPYADSCVNISMEPDPDCAKDVQFLPFMVTDGDLRGERFDEPDPHGSMTCTKGEQIEIDNVEETENIDLRKPRKKANENYAVENKGHLKSSDKEPLSMYSQADTVREAEAEPDPDDNLAELKETSQTQTNITDHDDDHGEELRRIQDPVSIFCDRLQKAIGVLRSEVSTTGAATVMQTLFKIIRNVIEHPDEIKYKRLRKTNPIIQRTVAKSEAAMKILFLVGFIEDVVLDEIGNSETYLILKRNDPGLLWLAKASLEASIGY